MKDDFTFGAPYSTEHYLKTSFVDDGFSPRFCHQPPVAAAAIAAIGSYAAGTTLLGLSILQTAILTGVSSLALSALSGAFSTPKAPDLSQFARIKGGGTTKQVRQPITPRRTIYGEARVSGPFAYITSTSSNQYLHMVIMLASHQVNEIGEVWLNDTPITPDQLDGNGNVTSGRYSGVCRIRKHDGDPTQGADSSLVSEVEEWTTDHRLQGIAYIYIRLKYDRNKFPSGIPNISAWVKGKEVFDTRDSTTKWTTNAMVNCYDYMTDQDFGIGADEADVDTDFVDAGANTCEEFVTTTTITQNVIDADDSTDIIEFEEDVLLFQTGDRVTIASDGSLPTGLSAATNYYVIVYQRKSNDVKQCRIKLASSFDNCMAGTAIDFTSAGSGNITVAKNAEPRYSLGGTAESDSAPEEILKSMTAAMAGTAIPAGGSWRLLAGAYDTPTLEFDEDDLAGPIEVQTKTSVRDRFNSVQGTYISPLNYGVPDDYPEVKNDTYIAEDGGKIRFRLEQTFVQRPHQSQRLAKIALEKMRQEFIFRAKFKLTAFKTQCGENINMTIPAFGWSSKPFEVIEWEIGVEEIEDAVVPIIEMKLKETASTVYDWNSGEETAVDPAPNTNFPNAFDVDAISGLTFDSFPVETRDGDIIYRLVIGWNQPDDAFVIEDGKIEIEYKPSSDPAWKKYPPLDGSATEAEIVNASVGLLYDIRIRAINNLGAVSNWNSLLGVSVGSAGGVTATSDWGAYVSDAVSESDNWGAFVSDAIAESDDWGSYV